MKRLENNLEECNIALPSRSINHCFFQRNVIFHVPNFGLPIGSPFNVVLECLFQVNLESFKFIRDNDPIYFPFLDMLYIYQWNNDLTKIMDKPDKTEPIIGSINERKTNTSSVMDISL